MSSAVYKYRFTNVILWLVIFAAECCLAAPPLKPDFDGRLIEYDTTDLRGTFVGTPAWSGAAMSNLYVTWDETNLYIALQCRMNNTKVSVLMDVDPGHGTGATTTTNWLAGDNVLFIYNDNGWKKSEAPGAKPFGLDFNIATEGWYNSVTLALYDGVVVPSTNNGRRLFDMQDVGNGSVPIGTAVEMVVLRDQTTNKLKGFETRIPWNIVYGNNTNRFGVVDPGKVVPSGATIRLFANIHDNSSTTSFSAPDTIPQQTSANASYNAGDGLLITDDYIDVMIDQNLDGFPDLPPGDSNAPYLVKLIGVAGSTTITGIFNEAVSPSSSTLTSNWTVSGFSVQSVQQIAPNRVAVSLGSPLPAAGSLIYLQTRGIEDMSGNSRVADNYLITRSAIFLSSYQAMAVAGDFQGWNPGATNMTLINDYTWLYDVAISSGGGIQFKFAADGSWTNHNFGRSSLFASSLPLLGSAGNLGGANILVTNSLAGTFRFIFNDQSRAFQVVQSGTDFDDDDLPDEWEIYYGLNPTDDGSIYGLNGASGDQDGDKVGNRDEYISDTDPRDTYSYLVANQITRHISGITDIIFPSSTNRLYRIEITANALMQNWTPLAPDYVSGTGTDMTITDTNLSDHMNYRVQARIP